ncbi:peptide/nickel transport system permease protein [Saccharothrix tamanrassetensis]|uniref:Peptide/nickel transport system permease protein n=1 Tax=Saccharothrix tamanrassetensis TaxID=1051531 RepID=A0A841CIV1_9PSEU|nr:ABC transporter permease [Saccharothrix tamanrassetensis]MBB5956970.1 peptide/nickel transport system permease protein [Saccharothrix tamanrassetensis]
MDRRPSSATGRLWLLRRVVFGMAVVLLGSVLVFAATQVLPGDPARAVLGHEATPERVAALRTELGLDRPLVAQYLAWLGGVLTGEPGHSLVTREPVGGLIGDRAVNSAVLVLVSAAVVVPLSVFVGAVAGRRRDRPFDRAVLVVTLGLTALPEFIIALLLVILLSTSVFPLLPGTVLLAPGQNPFGEPAQLVLPVTALVLGVLPYLARLVRGSVIDVYESEYVRTARLKGVPENVVLRRHVLRNALVPAVQGTALALAYLTGGVVVVEQVFNYPGLGSALVDAVNNRDFPVIQLICLVFAACYVAFNLLGDAMTVYVTPRLRTAGR